MGPVSAGHASAQAPKGCWAGGRADEELPPLGLTSQVGDEHWRWGAVAPLEPVQRAPGFSVLRDSAVAATRDGDLWPGLLGRRL